MSARCSGNVWKHSQHKGSDLLVMLAIADFAKDDGSGAWPSVALLAEKTRLSERNVQYILRKLEASGEIVIERHAGPRGCHLYTVTLGGEKFAPLRVQRLQVQSLQGGATQRTEGVQPSVSGGAIAIAPEPLRTVNKPLARPHARPKPANKKQQISSHFEITPELRQWAADKGIRCNLERETEKFVDYFLAKGEARADWDASWRLWMQKAAEIGVSNNGAHRQNATEVRPTEIRGPDRTGLRAALEEGAPRPKHA